MDKNLCCDQKHVVFSQYTGTDASFVIPEDVTVIADRAFAGNKTIKNIDLKNVRYVGAHAFQDCICLESVIMSNAVVIGSGAFEFCRSLRAVTFGGITEIGDMAFYSCSVLDIPEIPSSLKQIGVGAFSHTSIRRADLHRFEAIPPALFRYCPSLTHVDISGAREIGEDAFSFCGSLSDVRFGAVRKICARAFFKSESFEVVKMPETLQYIGDDAFSNTCRGLVVPKSVAHMGRDCFGLVDKRKSVCIYQSALYEFRNYFRLDKAIGEYDDNHFYLWESAIDVTILDDLTGNVTGFLPLYTDLDTEMRRALMQAFRPDNTFDYTFLDTTFFDGMKWNQRARDRLAFMRLKNPYELTESARKTYTVYFCKHLDRVAKRAVRDKDIDMLKFLCDSGLIMQYNITGIIDYSISLSMLECTAYLLKRQSEYSWQNDSLFEEL